MARTGSNLTEQQMRFVQAKATGLSDKQAGILAGYSRTTVSQSVSRLMARADIKTAIRKAKAVAKSAGVSNTTDDDGPLVKDHYDSPLDFMRDVMNQPRIPFGMRFEAVKQMLPYTESKVAPTGKKQTAKERAAAIADGGGTRGKFQSKRPPPQKPSLSVVK